MADPQAEFLPRTGLYYEPSAIQQLPDGRFLVGEDEKAHPVSLVTIAADGQVRSMPMLPPEHGDDAVWTLDDLEALALDPAGCVYALTSHTRTGSGEVKKARDKLVRFRVENGRMAAPARWLSQPLDRWQGHHRLRGKSCRDVRCRGDAPHCAHLDHAGPGGRRDTRDAWVPPLGGHLIISGPVARQQVPFRIRYWCGRTGKAARRVRASPGPGDPHA